MSKKIIEVKHHLASGCCMWSGIEDIYAGKTNQTLPEAFLFSLSSFAESAFIKIGDKNKPYMFSVADGRTRKTYNSIKDILGLEYKISEGRTLKYALNSIKREIDNDKPVILGPLDMYYLPYLKMYHKEHIPMHYVLMVGYDEGKDCVYIYDCDRTELLELPKENLIEAWNIKKNPVGDKNGFIRFTLKDELLDKYSLAEICIKNKAERQLIQKPNFVGVNAYYRFISEIEIWQKQLSKSEIEKLLASISEGFGMVPKLPNEIMGVEGEDIRYKGNYDRFGNALIQLGNEKKENNWVIAGKMFIECGENIEKVTKYIIESYCNHKDNIEKIKELLLNTGNIIEKAYSLI